jgi:hypothetical protein
MAQKTKNTTGQHSPMIFQSFNYKLLVVGLILITVGFTAMYLENEVSGFISLFISPIVIIAGYITVIFSIMMHSSGHPPTEHHGAG